MGVCASKLSAEEKAALEQSRKIDTTNATDHMKEQDKVKLLLLGAGESGKSTIFKQMKILYGQGFSEEERMSFRRYVWGNVIEAIKAVCEAADTFGLKDAVISKEAYELVMQAQAHEELTPELGQAIAQLWADPAIQQTWERRSQFQVIVTTEAYFARITEIAKPEYVPSVDDVLLSRVRTTGIVEEKYVIENTLFVMFDVGGQRNERKKWIHCFDDVNAVIFVAALSEFDQMLFEDESTNRMIESLNLFDEICNSRWFAKTAMILFLNKSDLFEEKIKRVQISSVPQFADYSGTPNNYEEGIQYFLGKFVATNRSPEKDIFHHVTCATNTDNIQFVFNACKEIILRQNLEENGFVN